MKDSYRIKKLYESAGRGYGGGGRICPLDRFGSSECCNPTRYVRPLLAPVSVAILLLPYQK